MNKDIIKEQTNEFLLHYLNTKNIDLNILSINIQKLKALIEKYDFKNNKDKYLSLSCIFGAFLGDSMGSICQFSIPSNKNHLDIFKYEEGIFAPGEVTDDSEMAMAAAFAYMDCPNPNYDKIQDLLYYYFCIWEKSPPKDIGRTITNALELWNPNQKIFETVFDKTIKDNVYKKNYDSLANGYLMRISTFIVFYYYANKKLIEKTINNFFDKAELDDITDDLYYLYLFILVEYYKNVEITHPNPENGIVSSIFVIMVLTGMIRNNPKDILFIFKKLVLSKKINSYDQKIEFKNIAKNVQNKLYQILKDVDNNEEINVFNSMGYYLHAFKLCLYFLNKFQNENLNQNPNIYYNIICQICDFGGDTDTNSAIVGTLFGPLIGYKNFGDKYFSRLFSFIPNERTEFISSFMVIYVDYLEKKYLGNLESDAKDYNYCTINLLYDFFFKEINL